MNYLSFEIRVGSAGRRRIEAERLKFHDDAVSIFFPNGEPPNRLGIEFVSSIDHWHYVYEPIVIAEILQSGIDQTMGTGQSVDLCVIDLTDHPFNVPRDPLLIHLFRRIAELCRVGICSRYAILLPGIPGSKSASLLPLEHFGQAVGNAEYFVLLVSNSGGTHCKASVAHEVPEVVPEYAGLVTTLYGDASVRLKRKCVRRLGHFQVTYPRENVTKCRPYSYHFLRECDGAFQELFEAWWKDHGGENKMILFDLQNNEPFRKAIHAFSVANSVPAERVADALEKPTVRRKALQADSCVIVLDAVDSGATLEHHAELLGAAGIDLSTDVVVAVNKTGARRSKIGEFQVHGFLQGEGGETVPAPCVQCELGLPVTPESHETHQRIRSFDMFHMTEVVGWEPEIAQEVPSLHGRGYPMIPKFLDILEKFGEWISYKVRCVLQASNCPDDCFIIHPDEAQSTAFASVILKSLESRLAVISVPRPLMNQARQLGNDWAEALNTDEGQHLANTLEAFSNTGGLILDIFNASDGTRVSLEALLRHLGVTPFAYLCLIDFWLGQEEYVGGGLHRFSLYQWYNPRSLL